MRLRRTSPTPAATEPQVDYQEQFAQRQEQMRWYAENDLPPFDPDACCPKCGWDRVVTEHKGGHTPSLNYPGAFFSPEQFVRRCERCQYAWREQVPVDAREFRACWRVGNDCTLRIGHAGDHEPRVAA